MSTALARRRLLAGGGAAVGLVALTACSGAGVRSTTAGPQGTPSGTATASDLPSSTASATPTATPTPSASPSPTAATRVEAPRLTDRLEGYLSGRRGSLGLELVDLRRGQSFRYEAKEGFCYSTIKVLVLTTLLRQAQESDADLTASQRALAERMITRSDNAATETLLAAVGRDEVTRVAGLVGMGRTEIDDGWWGHWRTVPGDLNAMVLALLTSDDVLDGARRTTARFLMTDVVAEQRWGVFAPESDRFHVAAKNGWGPLPDGYRLNSTGWVIGDDREYVLSMLSTSPNGFRYGRRTVNEVAGLCHTAMRDGLS